MKRLLSALLIVVLLVILLSVSVTANSPAPAPYYTFSVKNLPVGTAYVDILIPLPSSDEHYVSLVKENLPEGFTEQSEIVTYSEGEYRSYTFHYKGAKSAICLNGGKTVLFFTKETVSYDYTLPEHMNDVERRGKIRLAMLDENGNILKVSRQLSLEPKDLFAQNTNRFYYDGAKDTLEVGSYSTIFSFFGILACMFYGIIITSLIEWIVSLFFKVIKHYGQVVVVTNVLSQIAMWILFLTFQSALPWSYLYTIIVLEMFVYVAEFIVYQKTMLGVTWKSALLYTVVANTASLILGPLVIMLIT